MDQWGHCQGCGLAAVQIRERGVLVCEGRPEEAEAWRKIGDMISAAMDTDVVRCPFAFKDLMCGYAGPETLCDKTWPCCRRLGNGARFGGRLNV